MLNGIYKNIMRAHTARVYVKAPVMPTAQLGVGNDEILFSIGQRLNVNTTNITTVKKPDIKTQSDIQYVRGSENVSQDMFPKLYWIGE